MTGREPNSESTRHTAPDEVTHSPRAEDGDSARVELKPTRSERAGDMVGPYRLLELLGSGGFGSVWLAERRSPVVQRVAIKVLLPGIDSKSVLARFEQERQAMALMSHPSVARFIDAGEAANGRPYVAMEYVQGEPITAYCDRKRLSVDDRLALFAAVCEGVQHAHHKGIIHRDLKPSNIMVCTVDDRAVPKIIDFGIARAVAQPLTSLTVHTEQWRLVGTPQYMSPEQVESGAKDIDTRSDVYALGVVLYELLTGSLPFAAPASGEISREALYRMIRETEPVRPSARLNDRRPDAPTAPLADEVVTSARRVAELRRTRVDELARRLRRELDWIPLKAMRKDRTERYATPAALAADIRRYLAGEPLEAGPESTLYRMRKAVRRHRIPAIAAAAVVLALVAGLAVSLWYAEQARLATLEANRALDVAEMERAAADASRIQAEQATQAARLQLQRGDAQREFYRGLFRWRGVTNAEQITLPQILDRAERTLASAPWLAPAEKARQHLFLAVIWSELGEHERAAAHFETAHGVLTSESANDAVLAAEIAVTEAFLAYSGGRRSALPRLATVAVEAAERVGPEHRKLLIDAYALLAEAEGNQWNFDGARKAFTMAATLARQLTHPGATPESVYAELHAMALSVSAKWHARERVNAIIELDEFVEPYLFALGPDQVVPLALMATAMFFKLDKSAESSNHLTNDQVSSVMAQLALRLSRRLLGDLHPATVEIAAAQIMLAPINDREDAAGVIGRYSETFQVATVGSIALALQNGIDAFQRARAETGSTERRQRLAEAVDHFAIAQHEAARLGGDHNDARSLICTTYMLVSLAILERDEDFAQWLEVGRASADRLETAGHSSDLNLAATFARVEGRFASASAAEARLTRLVETIGRRRLTEPAFDDGVLLDIAVAAKSIDAEELAISTARLVADRWATTPASSLEHAEFFGWLALALDERSLPNEAAAARAAAAAHREPELSSE